MLMADWCDAAKVDRRLAAGADPNARSSGVGWTPLHEAVTAGAPGEVVDLLVAHGADTDTADSTGATPLWEAVRWGNRSAVAALLRAGADPWRPAVAGRSPGRLGLAGPLADLFAPLAGAPPTSAEEQERQARADALIASYEGWEGHWDGGALTFVAGLDEDELIGRLGMDPARCPATCSPFLRWSEDPPADEDDEDEPPGYGDFEAWVAGRDGGAVLIGHVGGAQFARLSAGTRAATVHFHINGSRYVDCWADGQRVRQSEPGAYPSQPWSEELLYRFGDHAHRSSGEARALAFVTAYTGVRVDEEWLIRTRMRAVPRARRQATAADRD
jgi:hypothetical protein